MFKDGLAAAWTSFHSLVFPSFETADLAFRIGRMYGPFFQYDYDKCRLVLNIDQNFANDSFSGGKYVSSLYLILASYELLIGISCIRKIETAI